MAGLTPRVDAIEADARRNWMINGNLDFWQRRTTSTTSDQYVADRFFTYRTGSAAGIDVSRQLASGITGSKYVMRLGRQSGNALTNAIQLMTAFETDDSIPLAGKTITFSFWARSGANFSGGTIAAYIGTGQGSDQGVIAAWSSAATYNLTDTSISSTWKRYTITQAIPSSVTQLRFNINYTPTGTAGANDYIEIAQLMVNKGAAAGEFSRAGHTLAAELLMCQRYFSTSYAIGNTIGAAQSGGGLRFFTNSASLSLADGVVPFPAQMRIIPNISIYNGNNGTINQTRDTNGVAHAVSSTDKSATALVRITHSVSLTADLSNEFEYTADAEL